MRLSHRLSLVFFLFGLAIAGGLQYNHLHELRSVAYERERRLAEAATAAVKALVESQVRAGVGLGRGLDQMLRHTDIAEISVVDARGRRLLERFDTASLLGRKPHPGLALERVRDGVYDVEKSVVLRGRREGRLEIGFRTGPLEARLREIAGQAVRSTFMALLAITLLAWLIGAWFALRIERIVPRIEVLSRDPLEFKPLRASGGSDEVARLAAAFNRLGASLKSEILRRRELEREKQELSAMLVHDLKTPLTVIRSGIALLREHLGELADTGAPAPPGSPRRTFELLDLSSQRLQRMVEDVLQLARLEEVSGLRERSAVDMAALLEACAKDFALVAAERKQRLLVKLPRAPLPRVLGDPALLRRVLDNLTHNAVEHTPAGGAITLAAAPEQGLVRVTVCDSGPGVPAEARSELFRKFFQKDIKRHVGNVGLGLAFCEKVVLRHEGTIGVEDAEPRGARFYFLLPSQQPNLL